MAWVWDHRRGGAGRCGRLRWDAEAWRTHNRNPILRALPLRRRQTFSSVPCFSLLFSSLLFSSPRFLLRQKAPVGQAEKGRNKKRWPCPER
eukprot:scaffold7328_cov314-Pinguiococcus_pyrenoidosus.AAC.93